MHTRKPSSKLMVFISKHFHVKHWHLKIVQRFLHKKVNNLNVDCWKCNFPMGLPVRLLVGFSVVGRSVIIFQKGGMLPCSYRSTCYLRAKGPRCTSLCPPHPFQTYAKMLENGHFFFHSCCNFLFL